MTSVTAAARPTVPAGRAVIIAGALAALAGATALVVSVALAAPARDWLGFTFAGIPQRMGEVGSILANNLRILAALFAACAAAQLGRRAGRGFTDGVAWSIARVCDCAVIGSAIAQAMIVGAGVGAYGDRMVLSLLPHGPLELGAYSLALALYADARRERVAPRRWAVVAAASGLALVIAAPMEVFAAP